jgi:hypothetical protein
VRFRRGKEAEIALEGTRLAPLETLEKRAEVRLVSDQGIGEARDELKIAVVSGAGAGCLVEAARQGQDTVGILQRLLEQAILLEDSGEFRRPGCKSPRASI